MKTDFLIIGGGIAGASIGYHLAKDHTVIMMEMESQPGYHTTGRSAAFYAESYGGPAIRSFTSASKKFLLSPPSDFSANTFMTPRGALHVYTEDQRSAVDADIAEIENQNITIKRLTKAEAIAMQPLLNDADIDGAFLDPDCGDLDVAGLHQAYLNGFNNRGGQLMVGCEFIAASKDIYWTVETSLGAVEAKVIINTAGAWADEVAKRSGVTPLNLSPRRRTVITAPLADGHYDGTEPLTLRYGETLYFKPESGMYLLSPEDETVSAPCDAQPELEDIALTIDRFEGLTGKSLARPTSTWAGLRTFAPDSAPIIGFDHQQPDFFWNVGQGGYGIQTCPAWAEVAAQLAQHKAIPKWLQDFGCKAEDYEPDRFQEI